MDQKPYDPSEEVDWLSLAKELIEEEGIDPIAPTEWGFRVFHGACTGGRYEAVKYIYETYDIDIETEEDEENRNTALHCACNEQGDLQTVKYLVEVAKANIHARNIDDWTPLHFACYEGHLDVVQYLVEERKADVHAMSHRDVRPLTCAAYLDNPGAVRVVEYLATFCHVDDKIVICAWRKKTLSIATKKLLLEGYARTKLRPFLPKTYVGAYPVHAILQSRLPLHEMYSDCVNIMSFPNSCFATMDNQGRLPLHLAIREAVRSPLLSASVLTKIVELEPRAATVKDPSTGLYPFEVIAGCSFKDDVSWFNVMYKMLRQHDPHTLTKERMLMVLTPTTVASRETQWSAKTNTTSLGIRQGSCTVVEQRKHTSALAYLCCWR